MRMWIIIFQPYSIKKKIAAGDSKRYLLSARGKNWKKTAGPKNEWYRKSWICKDKYVYTNYFAMLYVLPIIFLQWYKTIHTRRRKACHQGFFEKIHVDNICKENFWNTRICSAVEYYSSLPEQLLSVLCFSVCQLDSCVEGFFYYIFSPPFTSFLFCMWWLPNISSPFFFFFLISQYKNT